MVVRPGRLALALARGLGGARLYAVVAAGAGLAAHTLPETTPPPAAGLVLGGFAAAATALAAAQRLREAGRLNEYLLAAMGCSRALTTLSLATLLQALAAATAAWLTYTLLAPRPPSATALLYTAATAAAMGYGYTAAALAIHTSLPLLLAAAAAAKLAPHTTAPALIPAAALLGPTTTLLICKTQRLRTAIALPRKRRPRPRVAPWQAKRPS